MKKRYLPLTAALILSFHIFAQERENALDQYIHDHITGKNGKEVVGIVVPGKPPDKHREPVAIPSRSTVMLSYVPAFDWSFGCSATSAAMAAGYYDNNGYPDMYTGPANWGFMPMNNSTWGTVVINGETRAQCPLSATRNTLDGRTARGHVDDYWISYGDTNPDPYIANGWIEHTHAECTGDFMGTNQSALGSSDGSTTFYYYVDGSPYSGTEENDGCFGLKQFYLSRGYDVEAYFSQFIYGWEGNTLGFTFDQYKQEIDNGRPVLIQVAGHTMLGYGYDDAGTLVYLHDTWDYSSHTMVWGSSYATMVHYGVTVIELEASAFSIMANFSSGLNRQLINTTVNLTDMTFGEPTTWSWSIIPGTYLFTGGTSATSQNPQVQFTAGGLYSITLTVSDGVNGDSETKSNMIEAVDCDNFPIPVAEDFSDGTLPFCWQNIDNQGNGQVWQFNNPGNWPINTASGSNGFAILDSDTYGNGNSQNADLVTPLLDFTGYTSVNLSFEHYFRQYTSSTGTLSYSINGGNTWTVIQTWTSNTANAATFDQDMSGQLAGQANVKFKWNYVGAYDYYWAVDDISITGVRPGLWTGATSTSWNTAGNWSGGLIPGNSTDITIPFSSPNWPVYNGNLTLGTQCRNITMNGASQLTISGDLIIPASRQFSITGNGQLKVNGTITGEAGGSNGH